MSPLIDPEKYVQDWTGIMYTDKQLLAYGQAIADAWAQKLDGDIAAAVAAERERCIKICNDLIESLDEVRRSGAGSDKDLFASMALKAVVTRMREHG